MLFIVIKPRKVETVDHHVHARSPPRGSSSRHSHSYSLLRTPIRAQANRSVPRPARSRVEGVGGKQTNKQTAKHKGRAEQTQTEHARANGTGTQITSLAGVGPSVGYGLSSTGFSAQCSDWIRSEYHHVEAGGWRGITVQDQLPVVMCCQSPKVSIAE